MDATLTASSVDATLPVLLGAGVNLLNDLSRRPTLIFDGIEAFPDGVVKLRYLVPRR